METQHPASSNECIAIGLLRAVMDELDTYRSVLPSDELRTRIRHFLGTIEMAQREDSWERRSYDRP